MDRKQPKGREGRKREKGEREMFRKRERRFHASPYDFIRSVCKRGGYYSFSIIGAVVAEERAVGVVRVGRGGGG